MAEKEYIEREALLKYPIRRDNYDIKNGDIHFINGIESVLEYAKSLPPADVQEVRHSKWIKRDIFGEDPFECDCCGNTVSVYGYDYCPYCGAKME